jgi:hypothetical protein
MMWDDNISHSGWGLKRMFDCIPFSKLNIAKAADTADTGDEEPPELSATLDELVTELVASAGLRHINPVRARRWLLTTVPGQALLLQRATKKETKMPQVDLMKAIGTMEEMLNAQVTRREGESFAKSFTRKFENDIEFRKQWRDLTEAKHMLSLFKTNYATMTPTTATVGSSLVADDSAEAVRQLKEMAEQTGEGFEVVFSKPENAALAARTYTVHNRPNVSSTSGSELQR